MPSFSDSIFVFILALLLFGPKQLPKFAREIGKWVGEFRRASNEFKMQMEDELRQSEQEDRLKKIEAMEAAAPKPAELPSSTAESAAASDASVTPPVSDEAAHGWAPQSDETEAGVSSDEPNPLMSDETAHSRGTQDGVAAPLPIAEAGEVKIMPPATGLPTARRNALGGLLDSIPAAEKNGASAHADAVETAHGD